jgi:hypothetical protein
VQPQLIAPGCLVAAAKKVPVHLSERFVVGGRWLEAMDLQVALHSGLQTAAAALKLLIAVVADTARAAVHGRHACVESLVGGVKFAKRNTVKLLLQAQTHTRHSACGNVVDGSFVDGSCQVVAP